MAAQDVTQARRPLVLGPDEGEALWFNNDLLTIKATGAQMGGAILLVEELARKGKVTPLHVHPEEEETFYVLEGEMLFHLDGHDRSLGAGGFVSVARGVPHAYLVTSEVARSLIPSRPGAGRWKLSSATPLSRHESGCFRLKARSTSSGSARRPSAAEPCGSSAPRLSASLAPETRTLRAGSLLRMTSGFCFHARG